MSKKEQREGNGFRWEMNRDRLKKKVREDRGFTLVEMLIVVAIIAILIAISIPMIHSALERARHSTDAANERAAKAAVLAWYIAEGGGEDTESFGENVYFYNAEKGTISPTYVDDVGNMIVRPYGKHKAGDDEDDHTGKFIAVRVNGGEVKMIWCDEHDVVGVDDLDNSGLCGLAEDVQHE